MSRNENVSSECLPILVWLIAGSAALDTYEWKVAFVKTCGKYTEYASKENLKKLDGLFTDEAEELWPAIPLSAQNRVDSVERLVFEELHLEYQGVGFMELLYSSPDSAVAFTLGYGEMVNGTEQTAKGIVLLVRRDDGVRIKLNIFAYD